MSFINPVKLYKHDMANQRVARTWGPKGKPYAGCKGSICYRHKNVDWTVHRLAPAIHKNAKPGGVVQKSVEFGMTHPKPGGKVATKYPSLEGMSHKDVPHIGSFLTKSSPRWGQGKVPSRMEGRKSVPLPKHITVANSTVAKGAAVAGGTAVAVGGGVYAYRHRQEIKAKAAGFADKHPHFAKSINYHSKGGMR